MPRQLTEAQAWARIAQQIESEQGLYDGLCYEVHRLAGTYGGQVEISAETHCRMFDRVKQHQRIDGCYDYFDVYAEHGGRDESWWQVRIMLAQLFALEAADEAVAAT